MATLLEARSALKEGDRKRASQVLKTVLKENPSADAWYMAAQMTSDSDTAIRHLQRALAMNPKHTQARDMLREIGGQNTTGASTVLEEVRSEMENFGTNHRLLRPLMERLTPKQRVLAVGATFLIIITLFLLALVNLITPKPAPVIPTPIAVAKIQAEQVVNHFNASGLTIASIQPVKPPANPLIREQYTLQLQEGDTTHNVTIYIYDSIKNLAEDRQRLADEAKGSNALVYQTATMIYPAVLSGELAAKLENTFNTLPIS